MWQTLPLWPVRASTPANRTDALMIFMLAVTGFFTVMIFVLIFIFAMKLPRAPAIIGHRHPDRRIERSGSHLDADPVRHLHGHVRLGRFDLHDMGAAAAGRGGDLCRRQAVDVEVSASRGRSAKSTNCMCPWGATSG